MRQLYYEQLNCACDEVANGRSRHQWNSVYWEVGLRESRSASNRYSRKFTRVDLVSFATHSPRTTLRISCRSELG